MEKKLKDIAEELNLSISTVSRAINNTGRISDETRSRVQDAIKKYNYYPNKIAQSLRQRKTNIVGLIVPDIGDYFSDVIEGAETELSANGYSMLLADSHEDSIKEKQYINLMYQMHVDGLLLATVSDNFDFVEKYAENHIPIVFFDNEPDDLKCCKVVLNNIKATEIAVNHLVMLGHKHIALICGNTSESTARFRRDGFIQAMKKHNLDVDQLLIKEGLYYMDAGYASMEELILNRTNHPFTAVIASTYRLSCSALRAIKKYHLSYPKDLSFVGFDMQDRDELYSPSITSILQPGNKIGKILVQKFMHNIESSDGNSDEHLITFVNPMIKIGQSTASLMK